MILGNDTSVHQRDIDFDTLKKNCQFIILKASEGTGFTDSKFARGQKEARRVGLALGYYHFARPDLGNTAIAEADWFLTVCGAPVTGEVYVLDYEPPKWSGDVVGWCKAFLDRVYERIGVRCFIYLNQSQAKGFNWKPVVDAGYALWIAAYTGAPDNNNFETGAWPNAAMQQWTNNQTVPGIPTVADGNVFFGTVATFKKYGYQGGATTTPPADNTMPIDKDLFSKLITKSTNRDDLYAYIGVPVDPAEANIDKPKAVIDGYKNLSTGLQRQLTEAQTLTQNKVEELARYKQTAEASAKTADARITALEKAQKAWLDEKGVLQGQIEEHATAEGKAKIEATAWKTKYDQVVANQLSTITIGELVRMIWKKISPLKLK